MEHVPYECQVPYIFTLLQTANLYPGKNERLNATEASRMETQDRITGKTGDK